MTRRACLAVLALAPLGALAAPGRTRDVEQRGDERRYTYSGEGGSASFTLSLDAVRADLALSGAHPVNELVEARANAVRAWADARPASERAVSTVEVTVQGGKLTYDVASSAADGANTTLAAAQAVSERARGAFLLEHGYEDANGLIRPAHARLVVEYAARVGPVAEALARPLESDEAFAARALAFVQAIPYERRSDAGDTYRRPLAVLDGDRGACDSKAVLYLALVRAHSPSVSTALLYIPGHLYVGLDVVGDGTRVELDGHSYLVAEPAGPGALPLGRLDGRHAGVPIADARVVP